MSHKEHHGDKVSDILRLIFASIVPYSMWDIIFMLEAIYPITDGEQQASGSSEEESDTSGEGEASSEETIPIQVSPTSVIFQQKGKPANETSDNPNLAEAESEGEDTTSAPTEDNEDKSNSAESEEKPSAEAVPQQAAPPAFFSPQTLGSVPATRPTDEDDEREAGRYGFPYYEFPQEGAYADDFFQGNYYRVDPEFGGYEY